jgi:hypothetical protein
MPDFVPGLNDPSPVQRVIIFDYYDGALGGVMELAGGTSFRFDCTDETHNPDGCDERTYTLRPLPAGSFERLVAVLSEHLQPGWPVWAPIWAFPSAEVQGEVERRVDVILDSAAESRHRLTTTDTTTFRTVTGEPARTPARAV